MNDEKKNFFICFIIREGIVERKNNLNFFSVYWMS